MKNFHLSVFQDVIDARNLSDEESIFFEEDAESSYIFSFKRFLNPLAFRNLKLARALSQRIISDSGELDISIVVSSIEILSKGIYPLGPFRQEEAPFREHTLNMLKAIKNKVEIRDTLKRLFLPTQKALQNIIRRSLALPPEEELTVAHARRAAVSALLSYLRQDVGTCFASALAIVIQKEYPEKFITDIDKLLSSGRLSRMVGDKEYLAPINLSASLGDLYNPVEISSLYPDPFAAIASSPELLHAFSSAGIFSPEQQPEEQLQALLANEYLTQKLSDPLASISAHEIIQSTLLHAFGITQDQVKQTLLTQGIKEKSGLQHLFSETHQYLQAYEQARNAFVDMSQNALLKVWELSLATLAEKPTDKTTPHLLAGLGIRNEDPSCIGSILEETIHHLLQKLNAEAKDCESRYYEAQSQLDYVNSRLQNPINSQDNQILSYDHHRFQQELNAALYAWEQIKEKTKHLLSFPQFFLKSLTTLLPQYFKSAYDVDLLPTASSPYTDSAAGFRLFFTHGRANNYAWSPIQSSTEYVQFLSSFFSFMEQEIQDKRSVSTIKEEVSSIIQSITAFVHSDNFLSGAFDRILSHYQYPKQKQQQKVPDFLPFTPWTYISGGSLSTFTSCYFEENVSLTNIKKHPENAHELIAFYADALKDLPLKTKNYLEDGHSLITSSPSHAFSIIPSHPLFMDAWNNDWYSYTWIRDVWVKQHELFLASYTLSKQEIHSLILKLTEDLHFSSLAEEMLSFFEDFSLTLPEFYAKTLKFFEQNTQHPNLQIKKLLCRSLFRLIPLIPEQLVPSAIEKVASYVGVSSKIKKINLQEILENHFNKFSFLSSKEFLHLFSCMLLQALQKTHFDEDLYFRTLSAMRHHKLAYPAPLLFADSNWNNTYLGFTVNPGNALVELWGFNYAGANGFPMVEWEQYLSTTQEWLLFSDPVQYGMPPPPGYRSGLPKGFF
ncbi:hypothetical protein [Chlamydiifrater phoenicopteri]|uniref:hypothetical protein n=1 Tax=Chlamydiifrater phoenicopteri TaxID=2681469 RepID=UPI001BD053FC|nr:hypothetical protein [Chlamydiifrater phoenicopteri]